MSDLTPDQNRAHAIDDAMVDAMTWRSSDPRRLPPRPRALARSLPPGMSGRTWTRIAGTLRQRQSVAGAAATPAPSQEIISSVKTVT